MDNLKNTDRCNPRVIIHWEILIHLAMPFVFFLLYNHAYLPFARTYLSDPEIFPIINTVIGLSIIIFGLAWIGFIVKTLQKSYSWKMLGPGAVGALILMAGLYLVQKLLDGTIPVDTALFYLVFFGAVTLTVLGLGVVIVEPVPGRRFDPSSPEDLWDRQRGIRR